MALSPKEAIHEQKVRIDAAVQQAVDFIDEKLIQCVSPDGQVTMQIPSENYAMGYLTYKEFGDRLIAVFRSAGWDVRLDGMTLTFSIPKSKDA